MNRLSENYSRVLTHRPDGDDSTSYAVVMAVSAASGTPAENLPALTDTIDPELLDDFFPSTPSEIDSLRSIEFPYAGYLIAVNAGPDIHVLEIRNDTPASPADT